MRTARERRPFAQHLVLTFSLTVAAALTAGESALAQQPGRQIRTEPSNYERYSNPPAETQWQQPKPVQIHGSVEQQTQAPAIVPFTLTGVAVEGVTAIAPDK